MYMMANLNEEQLQEFLKQLAGVAIRNAKKIPAIKGLVTKVGGMFNKAPTQMPSGQVGALRLYQGKASKSLDAAIRGNASSIKPPQVKPKLDPRAVSDANKSREATQVVQRNMEKGRPSYAGPQPVDRLDYKPGDPQFTKSLQRYYADKRAGTKGLPK